MKFTIVERKMKIDDDLRQYALRKVEKLDRYFHQDSDTTLTFSELRGKQTVEITVRQTGLVVRAEETTTDMFASVDGAVSIRPAWKSACARVRSIRSPSSRLRFPRRISISCAASALRSSP